MKKTISALSMASLLCVGGLGLTACDVPDDETELDDENVVSAEALDEEVVVTRVELTPDGIGRVDEWRTTRREQLLAMQLEETSADGTLGTARQSVSTRGPLCLVGDFRIWEDPNYTGDSLCFYGSSGFVDLNDYWCDLGDIWIRWGGQIDSYKSGNYSARLGVDATMSCSHSAYIGAGTQNPDYSSNYWDYMYFGGNYCTPT